MDERLSTSLAWSLNTAQIGFYKHQIYNIYLIIKLKLTKIGPSSSPMPAPDVDWCEIGKKQSPINLNLTGYTVKRAEPFSFLHYGDIPSTTYVSNEGGNVLFEIRDVDAKDMPQVLRKPGHFTQWIFFCLEK